MKKQPAKKAVLKGEPVFIYTSACCGERATKEPCYAFGVKSKEAATQGRGHFRCPKCRKGCKVTRSKNAVDKKSKTE